MRVFNQDPATDMGRRAARAGERIGACPYPEGNWLAERWTAAYLDEIAAIGQGEVAPRSEPTISPSGGLGHYRPDEVDTINALLAKGKDANFIAHALNRPVHSVEVKIGKMMKVPPAWTNAQDRELTALARSPERLSVKQIAERLVRSTAAVGSRLHHLQIRLRNRHLEAAE
jgi:DNA-binding NarL/FixJ family response regulator